MLVFLFLCRGIAVVLYLFCNIDANFSFINSFSFSVLINNTFNNQLDIFYSTNGILYIISPYSLVSPGSLSSFPIPFLFSYLSIFSDKLEIYVIDLKFAEVNWGSTFTRIQYSKFHSRILYSTFYNQKLNSDF